MPPSLPITLVTTLHDPEGRLAPLAEPYLVGWLDRFRDTVIFTSPMGSGQTGAMLSDHGFQVIEDREPQGVARMGRVRLRALQAAASSGAPWYFLVDFDRLIHWEMSFPDELRAVEREISRYDFTVLGRTERAFESHPAVQRETERLANAAFAASFGKVMDITAGGRGLSAAAIEALSSCSVWEGLGVDGEWPLLCHRVGLHVGYVEVEGLEFESADPYALEIAEIGYDGWLARYIDTPHNWEKRLGFAHDIAAAARHAKERVL